MCVKSKYDTLISNCWDVESLNNYDNRGRRPITRLSKRATVISHMWFKIFQYSFIPFQQKMFHSSHLFIPQMREFYVFYVWKLGVKFAQMSEFYVNIHYLISTKKYRYNPVAAPEFWSIDWFWFLSKLCGLSKHQLAVLSKMILC